MKGHVIYIAAPLFSDAEKAFNLSLAQYLGEHFDVFLPQRDGQLMTELISQGVSPQSARDQIFEADFAAVKECTTLVAILDGRTIDEGVAFELGVAYSLNKFCVGLQTDVRRLLGNSNNPMIDSALFKTFNNKEDLFHCLKIKIF